MSKDKLVDTIVESIKNINENYNVIVGDDSRIIVNLYDINLKNSKIQFIVRTDGYRGVLFFEFMLNNEVRTISGITYKTKTDNPKVDKTEIKANQTIEIVRTIDRNKKFLENNINVIETLIELNDITNLREMFKYVLESNLDVDTIVEIIEEEKKETTTFGRGVLF
jgi:hypothetical protein